MGVWIATALVFARLGRVMARPGAWRDGPRSRVFRQAANRLPTEQALRATLLGGR